MIEIELEDCSNEGQMLNVTLMSNRYEFTISIGNHFYDSVDLNKSQVSELIVALVEMHKEMI